MKRKLKSLMAIALMFCISTTLYSCGGSENTPADKAMELVGYMQDENFSSYADGLYSKNDKEKDQFAMILEEKGGEMLEKNEGIDSYELVNEVIAENGNSATVKILVKYGNGTSKEEAMKMVKDEEGQWKGKLK